MADAEFTATPVKRRLAAAAAAAFVVAAMAPDVSLGQPAAPASRPDGHFGAVADPSAWPVSAIGAITIPWGANVLTRCTGALVAPKVVLTAAHCLSRGGRTASPRAIHFSAGLDRGVPTHHSVAERFEIGEGYTAADDAAWTGAGADWALVFLAEAIPVEPIAVRAASAEDILTLSGTGSAFQVGFGMDRPYLPSVARPCKVGQTPLDTVLRYACLTNFGYSGAPILFDFDGRPAIVAIGSRSEGNPDPDRPGGFACSAAGFAKRVADVLKGR
ncbi:trypsin [Roseiarcus fermentans]|uniref:Trypsin n=1 Tax=Roseiarcus fermentans TaxID=1473586 RepID=A0A366F513_9HYPH|nr:trypsin-like peptidase domain-containing protein [Roseiarcus fermentans]RBP09704.1 trypsin [Roseiarcus fermentans]